jgi:hypothetical protein
MERALRDDLPDFVQLFMENGYSFKTSEEWYPKHANFLRELFIKEVCIRQKFTKNIISAKFNFKLKKNENFELKIFLKKYGKKFDVISNNLNTYL